MGRYALEWAKGQRLANVEAKLVLILVADRTSGSYHRCTVNGPGVASEAGIPEDRAIAAIRHLADESLIATEDTRNVGTGLPSIRINLLIPEGWTSERFKRLKPPTGEDTEERTALYRLYDKNGVLLYAGIAVDPRNRWGQHARTKPWWPRVVVKEVEWHDTRIEALAAESVAIAVEKPLYNDKDSPHYWRLHDARREAEQAAGSDSGRVSGWVD